MRKTDDSKYKEYTEEHVFDYWKKHKKYHMEKEPESMKEGILIKNLFIPLGGADSIGASSYYVQLDGVKILFDAGVCNAPGKSALPDFEYLQFEDLSSYRDLDAVVLSHAHLDHIGALPYLYEKTGSIPYFATADTKKLSDLQLVEFGKDKVSLTPSLRVSAQEAVNNIFECSLRNKYYINAGQENEAYLEFYPAGHCPGAIITKLVTKNHTLVYTGDFDLRSNEQINNMRTDDLKADILIMNATKGCAKISENGHDEFLLKVEKSRRQNAQTVIYANNIAKYLDIFCEINSNECDFQFVVDHEIKPLVKAFEEMGYPVYSKSVRDRRSGELSPKVVITAYPERYKNADLINAGSYSLHPDLNELSAFAEKMNPKEIYIVHINVNRRGKDSITDRLAGNMHLKCRIVQCENIKEYEIEEI